MRGTMSTEGTSKKLDDVPARALGRRTGMISQHHRRGFQHTAGPLDLTPISGPRFGPRDSEKRAKVISPSIDKGPRGVDSTETQYQDAAFHVNPRRKLNAAGIEIARQLQRRTIPIGLVQDAMLLGACRKFDSWLNGGPSEPIRSMAYFEPLIAEIQAKPLPAGYSGHLRSTLQRLAEKWSKSLLDTKGS